MLQIPSLGLFIKFAVAIVFILLPYKHYTALFLPHNAILARYIVAILSSRLCVSRPFVTSLLKRSHILIIAPTTLRLRNTQSIDSTIFWCQTSSLYSNEVTPNGSPIAPFVFNVTKTSHPFIPPLVVFPKALFPALYSSSWTPPLSALWSLPFPLTITFTQMTQLFFSFHPCTQLSLKHFSSLKRSSIHLSWMTANLLTLNSSKTEFLLIGLKNQLVKLHNSPLDTSHSARNLGFISDEHLTFSDQMTSLSKACYYDIRQLRCIRPYLDSSTACTIATSIIQSKLEYCNSLYYKLPSLNYYPVFSRSRTLLIILSLKLVRPAISLPSYTLSTGSESTNALNTSSSLLPTKFSQLPNLHKWAKHTCFTNPTPVVNFFLPDCLHGLLPAPFLLS